MTVTEILERMVARVRARQPLGGGASPDAFTADGLARHATAYQNRNDRLGIDFSVVKLAFPDLQTMDPRIVRIAPGANNERHRHAHESVFVVIQGHGEVLVGDHWRPVAQGDVAFVPRWIFHQTRNGSPTEELVLVAITDFGFTSAILGDYDRRTRLAAQGDDAVEVAAPPQPGQLPPGRTPPGQTPRSREPRVETPYPRGWWRFITGKR